LLRFAAISRAEITEDIGVMLLSFCSACGNEMSHQNMKLKTRDI